MSKAGKIKTNIEASRETCPFYTELCRLLDELWKAESLKTQNFSQRLKP